MEPTTTTLQSGQCSCVMMFDMPSAPFTMNLPAPMGEPNVELMNSLKAYSATKYAKSRAEVEREINERWSSAERAKAAQNMPPEATAAPQQPADDKKGFLTVG